MLQYSISLSILYFHANLPLLPSLISLFFFFNDTATTEIYTLSLHDALPIFELGVDALDPVEDRVHDLDRRDLLPSDQRCQDRKSTRLNSSHGYISYAVFCLKKKKINATSPDNHDTRPLTWYDMRTRAHYAI